MKRLQPDGDDARFLRRAALLILLVAITVALYRAMDLIILAFGSMLVAIVIHALADIYGRYLHLPRRVQVPAGTLTVLAVIAFLVWLFAYQFGAQVNALVVALPGLIADLEQHMSQSPVGTKIVNAVEAAFAGSRVAQDIGGLVTGAGELILNFILMLVGGIFFAADPSVYSRGFLMLFPRSKRDAFAHALDDTSRTLRLWLQAQLISMLSMGAMVGVGLWIAGVPSAAALGLLAGLSEFIPYVGPTAAMLPALGLAATKGTSPLIGALVTYAVVRLIQTNFITPLVQQRVVRIPPAITVFAIIGIGVVFGLFGLFFSAAILVVFYTLIRRLYLRETLGEDV
ncbi:AI-2E family transporter [Stakelama saccharophila]|uniref:AI-2E family transporter n=1 Tax=Stakelama saccharophila TaxID=3075605 RepID=A0ABZ0BD71_9SPHN|nr:AI-2E family transporter [Stakelama sp. W311]WNO54833.1 AI-2E family transporter [Stakelama sp. W311]